KQKRGRFGAGTPPLPLSNAKRIREWPPYVFGLTMPSETRTRRSPESKGERIMITVSISDALKRSRDTSTCGEDHRKNLEYLSELIEEYASRYWQIQTFQ